MKKDMKKILDGLERYIVLNYREEEKKPKSLFGAVGGAVGVFERFSAVTVLEHTGKREDKLEEVIKNVGETFSQRLLRFIDESGKTSAEIYKRANIDRKLFSKIQCDVKYQPKKKTVLLFALALELNLDNTMDLLKSAGFALSKGNVGDVIVEYFIKNDVWDIFTINDALYKHDQPILE